MHKACVQRAPPLPPTAGLPTRLVGFDGREPTGHQGGKPRAIARLRELFPYETIVMVGDGITDLEAVQASGGADLFIGYGGVARRAAVVRGADWFVENFEVLRAALLRYRVAMVGSGAWACAAAALVAENTRRAQQGAAGGGGGGKYEEEVRMWVYEEDMDGRWGGVSGCPLSGGDRQRGAASLRRSYCGEEMPTIGGLMSRPWRGVCSQCTPADLRNQFAWLGAGR